LTGRNTIFPVAVLGARRIARPALARALVDGLDAGSVLLVAGAGYGKTMAIEEALEQGGRRAIWLSCGGGTGGEGGRLLVDAVAGLRVAVPGLADVVGDALAMAAEPVDVRSATTALRAELERLLAEPLVIVFDDAENLQGDDAALALVEQLLNARGVPLSLAIATRRPLPLRLTKLRAAGRLTELGPADLSLTAGECEELLRLRHGDAVGPDEVEAVLAASEGWPMGVALSGLTGAGDGAPVPRDELFPYLAEEVLERLDEERRLHLVDSSVPDVLTAELAEALGLPPDFLDDVERSALFLRTEASGGRSYHPLFRAFLRERLLDLRTEAERAALHERAAEHLALTGRRAEAVQHWLAAGRHEQALRVLGAEGAELVRTSPAAVRGWLAALPPELQDEPDYHFVEGQLLWYSGDHERAQGPLFAAAAGYEQAGNALGNWLARLLLTDTMQFAGRYDEAAELADGWEEATDAAAFPARAVAWWKVVARATVGHLDEAMALAEQLSRDPAAAAPFGFLEVLTQAGAARASGHSQDGLDLLNAEAAKLEVDDPFGRLPYVLGMALSDLRSLGRHREALAWAGRCERESERIALSWAQRDFRLQRATLHAQLNELPQAEVELARAGTRRGSGWRGIYQAEAEAHVGLLRGDGSAAAAARRALEVGKLAPWPWRTLATAEMTDVLARSGQAGEARTVVADALAALEKQFPADSGRGHRAWLLAALACHEHGLGESAAGCRTLRDAWDTAGDEAGRMVRAQWPAIGPVLRAALAEGALDPETVLPELDADTLVALLDHPDAGVRRAALLSSLAAGHPAALNRLEALAGDADAQVAAAAHAAQERLRDQPPPLQFQLLGRFAVRRAGWEIDEASWKRPMAARVVRFLLVRGAEAVPEEALFEAFWPDRDADAARQHLAQAVSRARKVLDLPGAGRSVLETRERTFRLRLRERDSVDADEFEAAAAAALAAGDPPLLERAAALWRGEPVPEDTYEEWSAPWRDRLVDTYSQVLGALVDRYGRAGSEHDAVRAARRLLELEPANERAHRQLMTAYARTGRTSHALRQYLECRRALVLDLGVEPSADTSALQARILAGEAV
jgi:ATP/maltotriose-dependent transcriptional regulator MalT/DNA-binding SARP family transcriptional activator